MLNQLQLQARVFKLACLEDCSADTVVSTIRREDMATYKAASKHLEAMAQQMKNEYEQAFGPAAQCYMRMTHAEAGLRGDLMMALHQLTTTNPRDVRDIVRHVQVLASQDRETWMGAGQPPYMVDAIEYLEAAGTDVTGFRATLDELYPAQTDDDDTVAPTPATDDQA